MHRVPVDSSSIAAVGYDAETHTLEIEFHNGHIYRYFNVPEAAHRLLMKASSIGEFVNTIIKPRFDCARV
jgi:KTSC domain